VAVCSGKYPNRNGGGWKFSRASRRQILKKLICRFPDFKFFLITDFK